MSVLFLLLNLSFPNTFFAHFRTIEALGQAINNYKGGVILVSHDERLIRMVCKELWICGEGTVRSIDGGFDEYRKIVEKELEAANA